MSESNGKVALLRKGWWVTVTVKPGVFPLRAYCGEIQAIDERGFRMTLVDWFTGYPVGWDISVPWDQFEGALVCTDQHDKKGFGEPAGQWQEGVLEQRSTKPVEHKKTTG